MLLMFAGTSRYGCYNFPLITLGIRLSIKESLLEDAGRWFLCSGIQETNGGVARYYRSDVRQNARISTEITGYATSALFFLNERTGLDEYRDAGLRCARFLTRTAWDFKLQTFPFEAPGDHSAGLAYFFDCGIIVRGLLAAWRTTRDAEFREVAIATGRTMLKDFRANGAIHPILSLPAKQALAYEPRWSASPGCYQLKSALAWYELFEACGEMEFLKAYEQAVESALATERDFLPGDVNQEKVMDRLHAYLYFLEGLLPVLDRAECRRVFQEGLNRVESHLRQIEPVFVRSDVYAQLLRARIFGEWTAGLQMDRSDAAREAAQIATFQLESSDLRLSGGFSFGRKGAVELPFVNPVSTAFSVQALALWNDRERGATPAHWHALI